MGLSIWQLLIILLIVVVLFGAGRIPRLMGDVGKGIRSFRSGLKDGEEEGEAGEGSRIDQSANPRADSTETGSTTGGARTDDTARSA